MKKALVATLLFMLIICPAVFELARADPYMPAGEDNSNVNPPFIQIFMQNNSLITTSNLTFHMIVSPPSAPNSSSATVTSVKYKADWQENITDLQSAIPTSHKIAAFSYIFNFTDIPEGKHEIVINATGHGWYKPDGIFKIGFSANSSATLQFTVDLPPEVTIYSFQKEIYTSTNIPLNVSTNKPYSSLYYSLDGKDNTTITDNATLNGLSTGIHNITVFAEDNYGITCASKPITFEVLEQNSDPIPYLESIVIAFSIIAVITVCIVLVLVHRRRKRQA